MIVLHHFGINVKEYFQKGKKNEFPLFPCQKCKRFDHLKKNGFRWRHVLGIDTDGEALLIPIQVLYCKLCHKVTSILPSFCVPYKVHTCLTFESFFTYLFSTRLSLAQVVEKARMAVGYYQLAQAWIRSFKNNVVNLTTEIRSLLSKDCIGITSISQPSLRYQDISPTWHSLQSLSCCPLSQASSNQGVLEKAQYLLWQKRKLTIFAYLD